MPKYNDMFKLNPYDIELIEHAMQEQIRLLSSANLTAGPTSQENNRKIRDMHELLGRLHNQKVWYAQTHPTGVPIG